MKKFVTAAIAAVIAAGSLGVASAADAQSRYDRQRPSGATPDRRDDRRIAATTVANIARTAATTVATTVRTSAPMTAGSGPSVATTPVATQPPRGYQVRQWSYGQRMPSYYTQGYVVNDYGRYGLRAPPRGYHYVRIGNDVVLAAVAGGLITAVIAGLFN